MLQRILASGRGGVTAPRNCYSATVRLRNVVLFDHEKVA